MATEQQTRYFEFQDDKSAKFWEVTNNGTTVTVRYGKIGTTGQSQTKELADTAAAAKHMTKLVAEKTGKGYVESGDSAVAQAASEPVSEVAPTAPRKKATPSRKTSVTNPAKDPEASPESLLALLDKDDATNRLLARHPRASADLLEKLSHSSDKATRQGVASNPNTPPETYVKLGQQFPKEFLANPALDLMLMVNPSLMVEVPEALLVRLLKQADCPASLLTWAAGTSNSKVQLAVAMNANAPESARQRLSESFNQAVREAVKPISEAASAQDPEQAFTQAVRERIGSLHPYELQEAWESGDIGLAQWSALPLTFRLAQVTNSEVFAPACVARLLRDSGKTLTEIRSLLPHYTSWKEVAKHHFTPVHVLFEFSEGSDALARIGAAENHTTPLAVLETLAKDSHNSNMIGIAVNPSTPEPLKVKLLDALDGSLSMSDLKKVATNPATPAPVLEKLSKHSDKWLRHAVAENLATPVPILEALAEDADTEVRRAVARNPTMPVPILEVLASHSNRDIQCAVAENPSTPVSVLETLAKNFDGLIRYAVAKNPSVSVSMLEILTKDHDKWIRHAVAKNPAVPVPVLEALALDSEHVVRCEVAKNPSASLLVLETLARDSDVTVRRAVAGNPSTTPGVLEKLSTDRDSDIKEAAIYNPNTPMPALIKQVKSKEVGVRHALASQSHRSPEILHSLWKDTHDSVRQAVASCPGLTQAQLDEMLQDCELETDLATLLVHPNMGVKSVECIFDKLFTTPAADSAWYRRQLVGASAEIRAAAQADQVTYYHGKDPNKAVLAKRAMAPLMALCAGPFIEPERLVKVVGSTDWLVRAAVARNPGTPPNLIKKLSADAHPLVAALANRTIDSSIEPRQDTQAPEEAAEDRTPDLTLAVAEVLSRFDKLKPDMFYDLASNAANDEAWSGHLSLTALITGLDWFGPWRTNLGSVIEDRLTNEQKHLLLEAGISSPNYHIRKSIAQWSDCPPDCLEKLLKDNEPEVQMAALNHPTLSHARRVEIINKTSNTRIKKMAQLLKDEINIFEFMELFSGSEDEEVRSIVADNQNTPAHVLKTLSADKVESVRAFVAKNKNTPEEVLVELAKDQEDYVLCFVAGNPNTPTQVLDDLASNLKESLRNNIGGNPNTPTHVLESLANAGSERVRKLVSANPSTPPHVLAAMSNDKNQDIRKEVAGNINTPASILDKLSKDEIDQVRMRVASNKNTPIQVLEELASDVDEVVLRNLAINPNAPHKFLEETIHHEIFEIKYDVAENTNAPALVLEELANYKYIWVRRLLANNPNTPLHVLEDLAKDKDPEVMLALARTHSTPPELVKHLESITARAHESRAMDALDRIERSISRESCRRKGIPAEQPAPITPAALLRALRWLGYFTPVDDNKALTKASRSKDWLVRLGAALHPDATEGILKLLRQDADPSVAQAAQFRHLKAA